VTGEIVNPDGSKAFTINDPYYSYTVLGTDASTGMSNYTAPIPLANAGRPEFYTRGGVHPVPSGTAADGVSPVPSNRGRRAAPSLAVGGSGVLTGLSVTVDAVVNLMVTDPNGNQSGFAQGNSVALQNIPNSGAGVDEVDDDVTGEAGPPVQTVMINSPSAGTFLISVTGSTAASYSLEIDAEASDGSMQSFAVSGTASVGVTTTYGVNYSGTPGSAGIPTINGSTVNYCDVGYQGNVNVSDVQLMINEALGAAVAVNDLNGDGVLNVVDLQIVVNAALGLSCAAK